jgi:hypothetical protein
MIVYKYFHGRTGIKAQQQDKLIILKRILTREYISLNISNC